MRYVTFILPALLTLFLGGTAFAAPGDVFYFEDFSQVKEGYLPAGWSGGQNCMVKEDRGRKMLVLFQGSEDSVVINSVPFPENYQWDFVFRYSYGLEFSIGQAKVHVGNSGVTLNATEGRMAEIAGKTVTASLRKEGPILRALVNGEQVAMGRFPGVVAANSLSFSFGQRDHRGPVIFYSIKGTEL